MWSAPGMTARAKSPTKKPTKIDQRMCVIPTWTS